MEVRKMEEVQELGKKLPWNRFNRQGEVRNGRNEGRNGQMQRDAKRRDA